MTQVMSPLPKHRSSLTWNWMTCLRRSSKNSFLKRLLDSSQDTDLKFVRTRAQRTGRAQTSVFFFPVLDPGPVSSPSWLIHTDSFEPFGGAVSGSCGFYAFKEFLQSRELFLAPLCVSPTGDLWQYVLSVHLLLTVALVTNRFLV